MYVRQTLYICVFFLFVFTTVGVQLKHYAIDIGRNLSLPCPFKSDNGVMWVRKGREDEQVSRLSIQEDGSLFLTEVDKNDSGVYTCDSGDNISAQVEVVVRTPPPPLANVQVHSSTILAVMLWDVNGTGGYPLIYFTAQYSLADTIEWLDITPIHISPNSRQIDVYKLIPNTTYAFRIWATNQLGMSDITIVYGTTKISIEAEELEKHFLEGIQNFDARIWMIAVGIVMATLVILGLGTSLLLYQECRVPGEPEDQEIIELVPNIILNPGFEGNMQTELIPADENANNETTSRLNNNTVVRPRNL